MVNKPNNLFNIKSKFLNLLAQIGSPSSGSYLMTTPLVTSSTIVAPSEVLPNTAISDRPKVKSVSKKDAKNNRKTIISSMSTAAAAAAASTSKANAISNQLQSVNEAILPKICSFTKSN